jgi:diguanylate cyclase (GGDEF)-like protein/PAS domain S-box-containing protein
MTVLTVRACIRSRTSFSASRDGSLKDVDRGEPYTGSVGARDGHGQALRDREVGRGRMTDGLAVALGLLAALGVDVPAGDELGPEIRRGLGELSAWVEQDDLAEDLSRPEIGDPRWIAVAEVIDRAMAPAYFCDPAVLAWLVLYARRIWAEHGPCAPLVGPLAHAGILTIAVAGDYRTGYQAVRRIIAVGEARHYEPMTSQARFLLTVGSVAWFESLEDSAAEALRAREGGLRHGDTYHASFSYVTGLPFLFDSLPTLDQFLAELEAGLVLATRTGNTSVVGSLTTLRQLARAMRGETHEPGGFEDGEFDDAAYLAATADVPVAQAHYHAERTLAALVFADDAVLDRHAAIAMDLAPRTAGAYTDLAARLGHAVSAARRLREGADDRDELLAGIDASREWLAARAADVPVNFGHLVRLLDGERAWAVGDLWTAAVAFDAALSEVERRPRPWQHALILERTALFHQERGLQATANRLLTEAYQRYAAWGAAGKVRALEADHPFLRDQAVAAAAAPASGTQRPETVRAGARSARGHTTHTSSESIDLVGVLRAAQALSSETNLDRLRGRVVEVLTMMTGATAVQLALWKDDAGDWFVPAAREQQDADGAAAGDGAGRLVTVDEAGARGLLPVTAFRYAERTGEPVRVDDATRDDRFARDPYFAGLDRCSLLVVPIQSNGRSRAMLLLENRLSRGAFSADRLDAVMLIAGQLAVCLDNALAERFRSLVQRSSELTLVCDRSGTVSYASTAAAELLGVEGVSLVGSSIGEVVAAEDRHGLLEWVALSGAQPGETNGALTCRLEPRHGDGPGGPAEERWAEVTLTDLSTDAAVGGLMLRLRDVTERRRLERALEELATTDPLTGVANRRRFDETLRAESERCLRAGNPLTLMLLDIDHFKAVNDTYGHPVGDAVLKAVAAQCRAAVRDIDLVARVGGEEFAVLLIDVGLHEGRQVADRMRKVIEATQVDLPGLAPLACTVSLGVAEFAGDSQDLMARADAALYRAKAEGRNRVCSSG